MSECEDEAPLYGKGNIRQLIQLHGKEIMPDFQLKCMLAFQQSDSLVGRCWT